MSEAESLKTKDSKEPRGKWFEGLKGEFGKITWLSSQDVVKQTVAVVIVSAITGFIIAILDRFIQYGIDFLTGLGG